MLNKFSNIHPAKFFIIAALVFDLLFNLVTPPMHSPDEMNHFYRAYQLSQGHLFPEKKDHRLGGELPYCFKEFALPFQLASINREYRINHSDFINSFNLPVDEDKTEFQDFPNTSYYSPVSYLPQAFAIFILRKCNCPLGIIYYGGRLFTFLVWLICMYFVIKTVPIYKWLFATVCLLPMNLYISNSFSADTVTNTLSFVFLALILKHSFSEQKITGKNIVLLATVALLLSMAKFVYIGLILLLLLIPKKQFANRYHKTISLSFIFLLCFSVAFIWSAIVMSYYIPYSDYNVTYRDSATVSELANYYTQKQFLSANPFQFFRVIFNSTFNPSQTYISGYVGYFGTFMEIELPNFLYLIVYSTLLFLALFEFNPFQFSIFQKVVLFCAATSSYVLLLLSQYLTWDPVGADLVWLIQGRYLIPIAPLLFLMFSNSKFKQPLKLSYICLPIILVVNIYSVTLIYNRHIKEYLNNQLEFTCTAEEVNEYGYFKTSNPSVTLEGGRSRTKTEQRSGNYSFAVSALNPYSANYSIKNLKFGDYVEVEAWKKGKGGALVVSGGGKKCEAFVGPQDKTYYQDKMGWQKMYLVYTMKTKCDSSETFIFLFNPQDTPVYFDDIRIKIKRAEG